MWGDGERREMEGGGERCGMVGREGEGRRGEGGTNVLLVGDNGNVLHGHLQGTYFIVATSLHSCDLLTQ